MIEREKRKSRWGNFPLFSYLNLTPNSLNLPLNLLHYFRINAEKFSLSPTRCAFSVTLWRARISSIVPLSLINPSSSASSSEYFGRKYFQLNGTRFGVIRFTWSTIFVVQVFVIEL